LDEIQAAILRVKLKRLDVDNIRRNQIAQYYCENISNAEVILPVQREFFQSKSVNLQLSHVWHLFVIRHKMRDKLQEFLNDNGVQTLIHYPIPPHKQLAYKDMNSMSLPITEQIHDEVLSLPISPVMDDTDVMKVVEVVNSALIKSIKNNKSPVVS
jgi:dTDP-4-amino-4,6-dideoxygalactose transaminase